MKVLQRLFRNPLPRRSEFDEPVSGWNTAVLDLISCIREWSAGKKKKPQYHIMACLTIPSLLRSLLPSDFSTHLASVAQYLVEFLEASLKSTHQFRNQLLLSAIMGLRNLLDGYLSGLNGSFETPDTSNPKSLENYEIFHSLFQRMLALAKAGPLDTQVELAWTTFFLTLAQHGYFKLFFSLISSCAQLEVLDQSSEIGSPSLLAMRCLHVLFGKLETTLLRVSQDKVAHELLLRCFVDEAEDSNLFFISSLSDVVESNESDWLSSQFHIVPIVSTCATLNRQANLFLSKVRTPIA